MKIRLAVALALLAGAMQTFAQVVCPPNSQAPVAQSPKNTNATPPVTFTWTASTAANVIGYDVRAGQTIGNAVTVCSTAAAATSCTANSAPPGVYAWKVVAKFANNCTLDSNVNAFSVGCPQSAPAPQSPANGATNTSPTPALQWSPVADATNYEIFLGVSGGGACTGNPVASVTGTTFTPPPLAAGTRYEWRVAAKRNGTNCVGQLSACQTFTTANVCPVAPKLLTPADGATNVASPVKFDWDPVNGATEYRVNAIIGSSAPAVLATIKETEYIASVPAGPVEWWIDPIGNGCPTITTTHFRFTAAGGCASNAGIPTPLSPANNATGLTSPVTFQWTAVQNATGYRVFGSTSPSDIFLIGSTTGAAQLTAPVPKGTITWLVQALFPNNCPMTVSRTFTFTTATGAACSTAAATPASPPNNATGVASPVAFTWTGVAGASGYELYVNNELQGFTTETTLTRLVGDGKNTWRVDTLYPDCPRVRSAELTFNAGAPANCGAAAAITAPAASATVTSPVNVTWNGVTGAITYRLWASIDGAPAELLARTADTSRILQLPSGAIELFIETLFANCPSTFSPHVKFTVSKNATCDTHRAVTLTAPIGGAVTGAEVTFKWVATDPTAVLHRIWVAQGSPAFEAIGTTTGTEFERRLQPGGGTWFVESFFEGCPSVFSNKETFTIPATARCNLTAPLLVSPVDNAQNVNSPVTFVWTASTGADAYRLFISLDGGDFVQIAEVDDATSITRPLPSGSYRWFIEAVEPGCPSARSAVNRFTIPRAQNCATDAPQLLTPADGATLTDSQVTLSWSPVSGAIGYVIVARVDDGTFAPVGETIATRFSRHFPEGRIDWFVIVLLNGCPSIESRRASFTIPSQAGCDNPKPILYSPAERAVGITSPVRFVWSPVPGATLYKVWAATGTDDPSVIGTTTDNKLSLTVPGGVIRWFVQAIFANCPPVQSAVSVFVALKDPPPCSTPAQTVAHAPRQVASGSAYNVRWTPVANANSFEVQESQNADFTGATSQVVNELFAAFTHSTGSTPQKWLYRVRAVSNCSDERGAFSGVVTVIVLPDAPQQAVSFEAGSKAVAQKIFIPGKDPALPFTATADKPWAHVTPASGTVGPAGITLSVTYDDAALKLGTNTATVSVTYGTPANKVGIAEVAPKTTVPVSVSTVTPVTSTGKSGPPQNALIIPVIGHAGGQNGSLFESDVRVANTSATTAKYQLNFTVSGTDGTQSGQSTTIQVAPGETLALDDILSSFFGVGADGSGATGVLEIRPLTSTTSTVTSSSSVNVQTTTAASSRTYNSTPTGTFGQYIPAILFSQFIGQSSGRLTLQQVAQSAAYRTNLGLTEGGGEPANVNVHVFNAAGAEVGVVPVSLLPGEHKQLNNFLSTNNIALEEGRFEIEVTSPTGKVTAYASTVDNGTNDPLCVLPVLKGAITSSRYVIPGVADINSPFAKWRSDIRVFNSGTSDVTATLTYFPQPGNAGASGPQQITVKAGEVKAIDNAINALYGLTNSGGAIVLSTPAAAPLVVTARTYNQTDTGTFGQFIPAVTPAESAGAGEKTLQLLQLEQSDRFRTNIGLTETTGNPVTVELSAVLPDSKTAIKAQFTLGANEFLQTTLGTGGFSLTNAYNVRVTVKVLSGAGRVTAYGSMIDAQTGDPTFVPPL